MMDAKLSQEKLWRKKGIMFGNLKTNKTFKLKIAQNNSKLLTVISNDRAKERVTRTKVVLNKHALTSPFLWQF